FGSQLQNFRARSGRVRSDLVDPFRFLIN
ncbi:unnamed protein product, partial [Didymodactylos carnosus]